MEGQAEIRVAVVMGGICGERDVSLRTGACVAGQLAGKWRVKPVEILGDGRWDVPAGFVGEGLPHCPGEWFTGAGRSVLEALASLAEEGVTVVFNALHGPGGEDGSFQGLLSHAGLAFTGPDVTSAAVTMDKRLTKHVLAALGIHTPRSAELPVRRPGARIEWEPWLERAARELPFPWVVKPNRLGSSVGVEIFRGPGDFLRRAAEVGDPLWCACPELPGSGFLVEELVGGRELTCGVLETELPRALPPIEIRPRSSTFFDYHAKYTPGASEEICPAPLGDRERAAVEDLALRVHALLGCAPLSRTDMFLDAEGRLTVLEINTLPGMTETSLIPQSAREAGIPLETLFSDLVHHALRRQAASVSLQAL